MSDDVLVSKVPMEAVEAGTGHLDASEHVPLGAVKSKSFTHFREGDVVLAKISPSFENGKVALATNLANGYAVGTTELVVLRPGEELLNRYLLHFLLSADVRLPLASTFQGSVGQQRISQDELRSVCIPVPSLERQQSIVEAIEKALSRVDNIRGALSLIQSRTKIMRQTILRQQTSSGPVRRLDEVASTASGGTPHTGTASYYGGHIPWAVIGDLNDGLVSATAKTITVEGLNASSAKWVEPGSLLVAMYGSIGKLGIAARRLTTNQAIAAITPDATVLNTRFLYYRLMADRQSLIKAGKGGAQSNISQTMLRSWMLPVPPLDEQVAAVRFLDRALSALDALDVAVAEVDARCSLLHRSILNAAFAGHPSAANLLDAKVEDVA